MKVGIGADHGGFEMKQKLIDLLTKNGHDVVDFGNRSMTRTMIIRISGSHSPAPWGAGTFIGAFSFAPAG